MWIWVSKLMLMLHQQNNINKVFSLLLQCELHRDAVSALMSWRHVGLEMLMTTGRVFMSATFEWWRQIWRSELRRWPSNRVTDSTCCPADLWATYQSHTRRTAAPWVTGLHLPASHSITADSAHGSVGRGHTGGRSRVHGATVPSRDVCVCVWGCTGRSGVTWTLVLTDRVPDGTCAAIMET